MQRIALCGHPYEVERTNCVRRSACDACETPKARQTRLRHLAMAKRLRDERGPRTRLARCGHEVPAHNGPPRRLCADCARPAPRFCSGCGADLTDRRGNVKWCSKHCFNVTRGVVRAEPLAERTCALPECDATFTPLRDGQQCCCEDHGKKLWKVRAKAEGRPRKDPWTDKRREAYHRRRALKKGASTGDAVIFSEIALRDGWCCHLCRKRVDGDLTWPHPQSASLDHVVPLSKGGLHDPANVRLAHLVCNVSKGNRGGGEQLLLIG